MSDLLTDTTTAVERRESTPMTLIEVAVEANADPDRLEKLMALQERWEANKAAERFADSLAAFQAECPQVHKSKAANFGGKQAYTFASIDDIMRTIQPLLVKHSLAVTFSANVADGMCHVECRVRCGRHVEVTNTTLPVPSDMRVNDTQKMGAALSYAKRYALCAALNIVVTDEDTDAGGLDVDITKEQAATINGLIKKLGKEVNIGRFLAYVNADNPPNEVSAISQRDYDRAVSVLQRKLEQVMAEATKGV